MADDKTQDNSKEDIKVEDTVVDASVDSAQEEPKVETEAVVTEEVKAPEAEAVAVEEPKTEETATEEVKAPEAKVEDVKVVEPKIEEKPVEEPKKEEKKAPTKVLTGKLEKLAKEIEGLTVLELSELSGYLEEKFGVSGTPMMAVGAAPVAGAPANEPEEAKTHFDVVLSDGGANKLGAIKAVRELRQDLGLMEAKKLVESTPQTVLENVKKDEAEAAVKKLTEAGSKAEMK